MSNEPDEKKEHPWLREFKKVNNQWHNCPVGGRYYIYNGGVDFNKPMVNPTRTLVELVKKVDTGDNQIAHELKVIQREVLLSDYILQYGVSGESRGDDFELSTKIQYINARWEVQQ